MRCSYLNTHTPQLITFPDARKSCALYSHFPRHTPSILYIIHKLCYITSYCHICITIKSSVPVTSQVVGRRGREWGVWQARRSWSLPRPGRSHRLALEDLKGICYFVKISHPYRLVKKIQKLRKGYHAIFFINFLQKINSFSNFEQKYLFWRAKNELL